MSIMDDTDSGPALLGLALVGAIRRAVREELRAALGQVCREGRKPLPDGRPLEVPGPYLSVKEAASLARLAPSTIRLVIRKGLLKAYKEGRRVIIKRTDLETFLEGHPVGPLS